MADLEQAATRHYDKRNLGESILAALRRMGKDVNALRPEDLAPVDAFHVRGRVATEELARFCQPVAEQRVLDVGCGLGGTARYLAQEFGCHVVGLDLAPSYVEAARMLTERLRLAAQVEFRQGSMLELPFEDGSFDLVWSEHAQMNIADKPRLFAEIHRVLARGGRLVFHDILQGTGGAPHYPAPWAADADASALIGPAELRRLLQSIGFDVKLWEDKTAAGRDAFRKVMASLREKGPPPLGLHLLLGSVAPAAQENMLRNLEENRIALLQAVLEKMR
ncbi:MAG TPA: class I SAM-dependent methyltransferase [bacterium]|nr:class I SAM-dependent methyltransferase [bacterium]